LDDGASAPSAARRVVGGVATSKATGVPDLNTLRREIRVSGRTHFSAAGAIAASVEFAMVVLSAAARLDRICLRIRDGTYRIGVAD
jgi:hypothetical protein